MDAAVFPDPAAIQANLGVDLKESGAFEATIYNSAGQPAARIKQDFLQMGFQTFPLDIHEFVPGVYFLKVDYIYDSGLRESSALSKFRIKR